MYLYCSSVLTGIYFPTTCQVVKIRVDEIDKDTAKRKLTKLCV